MGKIGPIDMPTRYSFGKPGSFADADIGRKYIPTPQREGNCAVPDALTQVPSALRFGDHRYSRAAVNPYDVVGPEMAQEFNRKFNITFEFRTFYKNGILFYMEPKEIIKDVYITAYLMDGHVVLNFKQPKEKGKKNDQKGLMTGGEDGSGKVYADGNFHKVQVVKNGKSISLQVDDGLPMEAKMKKSSENVVWYPRLKIGGPRTSMPFKVNTGSTGTASYNLILYPLQGCIKDFLINDKSADMASNPLKYNKHAKPCVTPVDGQLV